MQRGGPWAPKRGVGMVWGWHRGRGQGQVTGKTRKTQGREHCPGPALVGTKWVETERDLAPQSGSLPTNSLPPTCASESFAPPKLLHP